jgi:opacity protein-like surface antigen
MKNTSPLLASIALLLFSHATCAQWETEENRVQVFLGVMDLKDQEGEIQVDPGSPVDVDFSDLPTIGLEVETPYSAANTGLEYGINAGGGISWRGDNTSFAGSVGGSGSIVYFRLDNSFMLGEVHLGGYLRSHLGESVDVYLGGGPAILYGQHKVEDEEIEEGEAISRNGTIVITSDNSSDITLGFYARAGIEFDLGKKAQWGLGVRYLGGELDFSDTIGKIDMEGVQVLLTYSAWY